MDKCVACLNAGTKEKTMGLFNNSENAAEKAKKKQEEAHANAIKIGEKMSHYYYLDDLDEQNKLIMSVISQNFKGNTMIDVGSLLSGNDSSKLWNIQSISNAQFQQNMITIRLLQEISTKLDKLIEQK